MTLSIANITFDCEEPDAVAAFWSAALERPVDPVPPPAQGFMASIGGDRDGPTWLFLKVPEGKTAKNRLHLDLQTDDAGAEVDRLVALGATHLGDKDEWGLQWSVLHDVEGNEFCVAGPH